MATIKEADFIISSTIENLSPSGAVEGEPEITEAAHKGFFKISEEGFLITYREDVDGQTVVSDLTVTDNSVTVKRTGDVRSEMKFIEGQENKSLYEVPPYAFDLTVYTTKIRSSITKDGGRLDIYYKMNIGGANKKVRMKVVVNI